MPPYKNWYSIMTDDGLNRSNIVIVGKRQLLKVAFALIVMAIFNKRMTIKKSEQRRIRNGTGIINRADEALEGAWAGYKRCKHVFRVE